MALLSTKISPGCAPALVISEPGLMSPVTANPYLGSLSFKVSDLLNSRKFNMETYGENFYVETQYFRTTRLFLISFTYKINRYRMKERRRRGDEYEMEDVEF